MEKDTHNTKENDTAMGAKERALREFDEKFIHKTFDTYQGWSVQDIEDVKSFISKALDEVEREATEKTIREVDLLGGLTGGFANIPCTKFMEYARSKGVDVTEPRPISLSAHK